MKKNIMTVIILAASLVNLTLMAVMLFVFMPNVKQTNSLITKVAQIVDLELESVVPATPTIEIGDTAKYEIEGEMQVNLTKAEGETKNHFAIVICSLKLNKKSDDYKKLDPLMKENEDAIKEVIQDEIRKYTYAEFPDAKETIKNNILTKIQKEVTQSDDFVVDLNFSKYVAQ